MELYAGGDNNNDTPESFLDTEVKSQLPDEAQLPYFRRYIVRL